MFYHKYAIIDSNKRISGSSSDLYINSVFLLK